ncbi:serine/threonine-protein kinase [Myxococcota bacterium]|nr:serine/threonine-protein kinase [Myxococcota bacterium]
MARGRRRVRRGEEQQAVGDPSLAITQPTVEDGRGVAPPSLPEAGELVGGRYRVVRQIGRGGVGVVFRAMDEPEDVPIALKVLTRVGERDIVRFQREHMALRALRTPHVVALHGTGYHRGAPWLAMELVDGLPLDLVARRGRGEGPVAWPEIAPYAVQLLSALQQIHGEGIVHRDLKPGNVFVDRRGVVRLLDFGLAWRLGADAATDAGTAVGTVRYMAPEQVSGEEVDLRSDLYSVGILLYELVTGDYPYPDGPAPVLMHQHLFARPRDPRLEVPDLDEGLAQLLLHLLEKRKERRPADAGEVLQRLGSLAPPTSGDGTGAAGSPSFPGTTASLPLVGRGAERARIERALDDVGRGRSRVVCVVGEAGTGKTRIVAEACRLARRRGIRCVEARPGEWASGSYSAALPVLGELFGAGAHPVGPAEAELLKVLLAGRTSGSGAGARDDAPRGTHTLAEARAHREAAFEELVVHMILAAAEGPLALVFDDLDRADRASRDLVVRLATRAVPAPQGDLPLLIVVSARDERLVRRMSAASGPVGVRPIPLRPLRPGELAEWFEPSPEGAAAAWHLHARSGGLPRDALEGVREWLRRGRLRMGVAGRLAPVEGWEAAAPEPGSEDGAPAWGGTGSGLKRTERMRLLRLPPDVQRTLRAASLLGPRFSFELLAVATGEDPWTLLDHLEQAEEGGVVEERRGPDAECAGFRDEGLAERLRGTLAPAELERVRGRVVRALLDDAGGEGRVEGRTADIDPRWAARLLSEAGEHRSAGRYWRRAAASLRRMGDRRGAEECALLGVEAARIAGDALGEARAMDLLFELGGLGLA